MIDGADFRSPFRGSQTAAGPARKFCGRGRDGLLLAEKNNIIRMYKSVRIL